MPATTRKALGSAIGSVRDIGEHGRLAALGHVDQRDVLAGFVFGVKIVTAVMLSGEEATYGSVRQGNVSDHLNFVFR